MTLLEREHELADLRDALADARDGRGMVVLVYAREAAAAGSWSETGKVV